MSRLTDRYAMRDDELRRELEAEDAAELAYARAFADHDHDERREEAQDENYVRWITSAGPVVDKWRKP